MSDDSQPGQPEPASMGVPAHVFVSDLPDLIDASEYADQPEGNLVRLRLRVTSGGVEVIGDAMRPVVLEALLAAIGADSIDQMLCG